MPSTFSFSTFSVATAVVYSALCLYVILFISCEAELPMPVRVCSFESRRSNEMETLIKKLGGEPTIAPSMREVPLEENVIAGQFADRMIEGQVDVVIFMTGVGAKTLLDAIAALGQLEPFLVSLAKRVVIVRGPKPFARLRERNIRVDYRAEEPNTWREILALIDNHSLLQTGKKVAVQEYGKPNLEFYEELKKRGAEVLPVPVYRWEFPTDLKPLHQAIQATIAGQFDLLLFTSANQIDNVLQAAEQLGERENWLRAARKCTLASIGPTCSERMRELGLPVHLEPSHPKMAHLVREAIEYVSSS